MLKRTRIFSTTFMVFLTPLSSSLAMNSGDQEEGQCCGVSARPFIEGDNISIIAGAGLTLQGTHLSSTGPIIIRGLNVKLMNVQIDAPEVIIDSPTNLAAQNSR